MKRNKNLIPFSHDHHQGLVFALRIKKGVKNDTKPAVLKNYILGFWEVDLHHHFHEEERLLGPHLDGDHPMTRTFEEDHQWIRDTIQEVADAEDEKIQLLADPLADRIEKHIRFEERQFFPLLESQLSVEDLEKIGAGLSNHKEVCFKYSPEFWKS